MQQTVRKRGVFSARFMRSLPIGAKLWTTTALLSIPLIVLVAVYVHSLSSTVWSTADEQQGLALYRPLDAVAQRLVRREELMATGLARRANIAGQLRELNEDIDAKLVDFTAVETLHGDAETHRLLKDFTSQWAALKASNPAGTAETLAVHERVMETAIGLSTRIATDWSLSLDPEVTAYNLVDVTVAKLPDARRFLIEARAHMVSMYADGSYIPAEGARVASLLALFNDRMIGARDELKTAAAGAADRPELVLQINELSNNWDGGVATWTSEVARNLATGHPPEDELRSLLNGSAKYAQSLTGTQEAAIAAAGDALAMRHSAQSRLAYATLAVCGSAIAFAVMVMVALSRRIAGAMSRLDHIARRITDGHYDSSIDDSGTDEISRLFAAMNRMQGTLSAAVTRAAPQPSSGAANLPAVESRTVPEDDHERIRATLDCVSGCVMVADCDGKIVYLNAALDGMLRLAEADIRRQLPGFSASAVHGAGFEIFHQRPEQQRRMVTDLNGAHVAQIELGGRTFRLTLNPVLSSAGVRVGTSVEWNDRTTEVAMEREVATVLQAVVQGDLSHRLGTAGKSGFFETLARGMNQLIDNVDDTIRKVKGTSDGVHAAADDIFQSNVNLSQRIEQQSASLEQTAASMEEITATVKQNADNADQANRLASAAREQAQAGGAVVNQAIDAMADINESSKKIANIIGVIDEIAFQTNLLALNAAVEAARAGEQGRGFAVVASEVRSLAGRSAGAAKEIKELIRDSVEKVEDGTQLVTQSGKTLEGIVVAVKKVTDVVAEIASASGEQTRGIDQVNVAITHMDQMTQQNAALIEQTSASSQAMAHKAQELAAILEGYRVGSPDVRGNAAPAAVTRAPRARATG